MNNYDQGEFCKRDRYPKCRVRVARSVLALCVLIFLLGFSCDPQPRIVIDSPTGGTVGLTVTFRWHLENGGSGTPTSPGETYQYDVRLDKGVNACDDQIEQSFDAGTRTCLAIDFPSAIYDGQQVEFAIRATNSRGDVRCTTGAVLSVSAAVPPSAPCGS